MATPPPKRQKCEEKIKVRVFREVDGSVSFIALLPGLFANKKAIYEELKSISDWNEGKFMGHRIPRVTRWHGPGTYKFGGKKCKPFEFTKVLKDFQETVKSELRRALGDTSSQGVEFKWDRLNSVLVNKYSTGEDSISAHADDEPEFGKGPTIVSVNLGATRTFVLMRMSEKVRKKTWKKRGLAWIPNPTRKPDRMEFVLRHGDCLVMAGSVQDFWVHSVPKQKKTEAPQSTPRYNLTFRPYAQRDA